VFRLLKRHRISRYVGVLLALFLLGQVPIGSYAAPAVLDAVQPALPAQNNPAAPVSCAATTCPASAYGLPYCIEEAKFCVYYDTAYVTEAEAAFARDVIQDHWDLWGAAPLNFAHEPKYSGKLQVELLNNTGCNGGTGWSVNYMTTYAGCWDDGDVVAQMVLGHELTHRLQYAYDTWPGAPRQTKFLKEGSARATQDNWFADKDLMPASPGFTYCAEAASYLGSTNTDLSSLWYASCLWWKYAMEQYGTIAVQPFQGVDFVEEVYLQNELGHSSIAAVNQALSAIGAGITFNDSFKQFAVPAYTKDLSGLPDDSYDILDEDQPPGQCGSVSPAPGGTIQVGTDATWNNQSVSKYGVRYYEADIGANCPVVSASFHQDDGDPAFYHIVTQNGNTFKNHVEGSGNDWSQAFMNDGVTKVVAILGSLGSSTSDVDITLSCPDPVVDIKLPNDVAVAYTKSGKKFLAQVLVTNGSPTGPVVAGLTNSDFKAKVNNVNATVSGGGYIQEQYWLVIEAPGQGDGTYDLEIILEEPGTAVPIASDTNANSVVYTSDKVDQVLVIDRSGSMGWPTDAKLQAAKDAAEFYVDITRNNDGLAVVPYDHEVEPLPFDMQSVNPTVRTNAKNYISVLSEDNGATSIGDGMQEAANQRTGSPTGNPLCSYVLLSDGMENSPLYWADVVGNVQATGCPVTSIAFGPESNEMLMQTIASDTGGLSFYNDVFVSTETEGLNATTPASMTLDLVNTYEYAQGRGEGRQRLLAEQDVITYFEVKTHTVTIDDSVSEALFALNWYSPRGGYARLELELFEPDGTKIDHLETMSYTFPSPFDPTETHVGWRIPAPDPGPWKMVVKNISQTPSVPYQVLASGESNLTLELLLPDRLGGAFFTGDRFPLFAILSNDGPIPGVPVYAMVTAPDLGCPMLSRTTMLQLFDDGRHGDNQAMDGVYANTYTRVTCAAEVEPAGEGEPTPPDPVNDEGGYRVSLRAMGANFQREALGAFSALEGDDLDGDGMPDGWEQENNVDDPAGDPDLDFLQNLLEYLVGTDPNNSDTDGGGESDYSEVINGLDPLDPADDRMEAPDFFHAAPDNGAVQLTYDFKGQYQAMWLYRAPSPDGPWTQITDALPADGFYSDPVPNGMPYYYRLFALQDIPGSAVQDFPGSALQDLLGSASGNLQDVLGNANLALHISAVLDSEEVTPSTDPWPPQAFVIVNGGATSTLVRDVTLTFEPYEYEEGDPPLSETFDDITEMMISNDPSFAGASWQGFYQGVPWTLGGPPNALNFVYVKFRDDNANESVGAEVGVIFYGYFNYLPIVIKAY